MIAAKTLKTLAAAAAVVIASGSLAAQASTCDILNFTTSTACVSPVTGGPGGNVNAAQMNAGAGVFGSTSWSLLDSIGSASVGSGTQTSAGGLFSFTYNAGLQGGTWSLDSAWDWGAGLYAFVIKGATDNAVYLMDKNATSGSWNVLDLLNNGGNHPDLSNVRLFGTTALVPATPAPIPLPAAGLLLVGALGGLAALRRRRTA